MAPNTTAPADTLSSATPSSDELAPPSPQDIAWVAAIAVAKATVIALAVDAFVNSSSPRFSGKAMRIRAIGYAGMLLVVPAAWRLRGHHGSYPRQLDLLLTLPVLGDAAGNAVGIYQRAHVDDAVHFANGAVLTAVVGSLALPRARTPWEAAGLAAATGIAGAAVWEMFEWTALKLGAKGMDLSYDDTMEDLIETSAGALVGAALTLLRHPSTLRRVPGLGDDRLLRRRRA